MTISTLMILVVYRVHVIHEPCVWSNPPRVLRSSVVRASDQCTEGHWFNSCRGPRFFLCPVLVTCLACVAGAKRGGGGGREKGKREGSACSKSLCFCITPTNFLVIRLRLLSIKCRYTHHCRKHYTHGLKKFA